MVGINGGGKPYRGIFDGQGHKLTINYNLNEERVAPFRRINGATIRNLIVEGTITTTSKLAAGIVGGLWQNGSTIENCIANVTINDTNSGDATHGGICGSFEDVNGANTIQNCAFIGTINAPNRNGCGGIVGWTNNNDNNNIIRNCYVSATMNVKENDNNDIICRNNGNVVNCYYTIDITGLKNDKNAVYATSDQITSGEFAYKLNGNNDAGAWHQALPGDDHPVPFGTAETLVYANGELNCDGTPKGSIVYSNAPGSNRDDHDYANGFCSACGEYQTDYMTANGDGFFEVSSSAQLTWYAYTVNNVNAGANAILMNNIDMDGVTGYTPIGQDGHDFKGHFNGQGHRILNLTTTAGMNNQALFGQAVGPAIIENVIIDASCTIQGAVYTAGILGHVWGNGVIIRNCGNEAAINGSGNNAAGILGCSEKIVSIINCYNTGAVKGAGESAAICGWMGANTSVIQNCFNSGTVTGQDGTNRMYRKPEVAGENLYDKDGVQGTAFTAEDMASGKLAFMLNGNQSVTVGWYQTLGTDAHPYPFGSAIVYANGDVQCDGVTPKAGSEVTYSNVEGAGNRDPHSYVDGICTVCRDLESIEGVYQVGCADALVRFAEIVNNGSGTSNAILTKDIDMTGKAWTPIGQDARDYAGHFDGQNHRISNLDLTGNLGVYDNQALFGQVVGTAVIENVIMDASCTIKGKEHVAGILGRVWGSGAIVRNCVNEASIEASGQHAAGIVSTANRNITIDNCVNKGTVTASSTVGGILARNWDNSHETLISNCTNEGTITSAGDEIGGIFGAANNELTIQGCVNKGSVNGKAFTGGIVGRLYVDGVIVKNCGNEGDVTGSKQNAAGIVGCTGNVLQIIDCYNIAAISGESESAAICGWMGSNTSVIRNCFNSGTVAGQDGTNRMYRKGDAQAENLYDIDGVQATAFTDVDMASGKLAYLLNGSTDAGTWHQTLGTDANPVPFTTSNAVYGAAWDGTNTVYYNNVENVVNASNVVINDLCDNFAVPAGATAVSAQKVTYSRSGVAGFNTVCLPFALTSVPTGAQIYTIGDITASSIKVATATEVAAGVPCLVEFPADYNGTWDIEADDANIAVAPVNAGALKGSYTTTTIEAGKYKLNSAGTAFAKTTAGANIYPFRAYVDAPAGAKELTFDFGGETAISDVLNALNGTHEVYDLNGRKQERLQKGVNIVKLANGETKKIVVE